MASGAETIRRWVRRAAPWLVVLVPAIWGVVAEAARTGPLFR